MMDHAHVLSLSRQAKALGISRGSIYYQAQPVSDADLAVMRPIDEVHLNYPFAGSRMLQGFLVREARASLGRYINGFYNTKHPHSSLDGKTPDEAYFNALPAIPLAA